MQAEMDNVREKRTQNPYPTIYWDSVDSAIVLALIRQINFE